MKQYFTLVFILLITNLSIAQVIMSPLSTNPQLTQLYNKGELKNSQGEKSENTLHLPFIDDFSKNHQPGAEVVYWEDNFVFINPTYGVSPPTIGVATFEGLNFNGYPYNFESPTSYGQADVLTSCIINLSEDSDGDPYAPSDSIYLSFYYQAQGLGDSPESVDSLVLEFYDAESDTWIHQWSTPGIDLADFELVYIPIIDDLYFSPDFKFRFRNYATLSGNLDHWHIDMVWLDKNRSTATVGFPDVGFQYPVNQLLTSYTSMPYAHYQLNAENNMISTAPAQLVNNHPNAVNLSNVKMVNYSEGNIVNETPYPGNIENFPGQSSNIYAIPVNEGSEDYYFDDMINEPFVSFKNEFVMTSGTFDLVSDNDTITYVQELSNYYSYDDGSAEAGIGLNQNGGRMLNKFQTVIGDSIFAFKIYFNPITYNPVYPFFMVIYDVESGVPGDIIHFDQDYKEINYIQEGHDIFAYYFLDSAVYVNGEFFIGVAQTSETSLNIGFDRNIDSHQNIFYNLGNTWEQLSSSFFGSMMMRPVFVSEMDDIILGIEEAVELDCKVYPNPANNVFTVLTENERSAVFLDVIGVDGRVLIRDQFYQQTQIDCSSFTEGMYILRLQSESGSTTTRKIMIQH
jgi:hypothetical protein